MCCHATKRGSNDSLPLSLHLQVNSAIQEFIPRNTGKIVLFVDVSFENSGEKGYRNKKTHSFLNGFLAGATGFEPAVSALTGPHV